MRSPDELDHVEWQALSHAYGSAEDIPGLIRALYLGDEEEVDEAVDELYGTIHHQGSVYTASAPTVAFLTHAVRHVPGKRAELLMLLAGLAYHDRADADSPHWQNSSVSAICTELCREMPGLLPYLDDPERAVRRAVLRVVAAVADVLPQRSQDLAVEGIGMIHATDPEPVVRADALVVLNQCGQQLTPLDSQLPEVRLAAAMLLAERSEPPYPAELVEILARDGAEPDPGADDFPWSGYDTRDERLTRLLTRDPRAGLAVASQWVADGDVGSRGSSLAGRIAETWRDQEAEVLALLLAALPHQKHARALASRFRAIGYWIECLPAPGTDVRDALHRYASADDEGAEPALLALVRSGDARALDLVVRRPSARLLAAAARRFPEAAERLLPVIRRELAAGATGNDGIALVLALKSFGCAAREAEPELVECLRTGRAAIVAARQLGRNRVRTQVIIDLLDHAVRSSDLSLRASAAVARYRLTHDADLALDVFRELLSAGRQTHWSLNSLPLLGADAVQLLPRVESLLEDSRDWTRMAAAETHHRLTGSPDRALPVLAGLIGASPLGLAALRALAAIGRTPEEIRPALREFATSPTRVFRDSPYSSRDHADEELRALARVLLDDSPVQARRESRTYPGAPPKAAG